MLLALPLAPTVDRGRLLPNPDHPFFPTRAAEPDLSSHWGDVVPQGGLTMKPNGPSFERLEQVVTIIARHADYPGKHEAFAECLCDIEDRWARGLLTLEQRLGLNATLLRGAASSRDRKLATTC
jgi:hypothetical protein